MSLKFFIIKNTTNSQQFLPKIRKRIFSISNALCNLALGFKSYSFSSILSINHLFHSWTWTCLCPGFSPMRTSLPALSTHLPRSHPIIFLFPVFLLHIQQIVVVYAFNLFSSSVIFGYSFSFVTPYLHSHLFFLIEEADYILKELVLPKFDFTLNLKVSLPICRKIRER